MPINEQKVIGILREEVKNVPDRCPGYHAELEKTIAEIFMLERSNRERRINIQQEIDAKCDAAGRWLAERQS